MSDPFSIAAGVMGIVGVSAQVLQICYRIYDYYGGVKNAPEVMKQMVNELEGLEPLLSDLRKLVISHPQMHAVQAFRNKESILDECQRALQELMQALNMRLNPKGIRGMVRKAMWPLSQEEASRHLLRIERIKSTFTLGLSMDNGATSQSILRLSEEMDSHLKDLSSLTQNQDKLLQRFENSSVRKEARELRQAIIMWLYPYNFYERHQTTSSERREGTGTWLLESREFRDWRAGVSTSRLLIGRGIAGAGKTFLSSLVIDYFQQATETGIAYIYFHYKDTLDNQRPTKVLSSLVRQLLTQLHEDLPLPQTAMDLYNNLHHKEKRPTEHQLHDAIIEVSKLFQSVFLVFDALDECHEEVLPEVLSLLNGMADGGIPIFVTSRPVADIKYLTGAVEIKISAHKDDISSFLRWRICQLETRKPPKFKLFKMHEDIVISEILNSAGEMFLLARFHFEFLVRTHNPKALLAALKTLRLPSSTTAALELCYKRVLQEIKERDEAEGLAFKVLAWLSKATRPLLITELREALAIEVDVYELDPWNLTDEDILVDVCGGLVEVDKHSGSIVLAHYTIQQYLTNEMEPLLPKNTDAQIAVACITYLSFEAFAEGPCQSLESFQNRLYSHPLLEYAAHNLSHHLRCQWTVEPPTDMLLRFLGSPNSIDSYLQVLSLKSKYFSTWSYFPKGASPLHTACRIGYAPAVISLIASGANIFATDNRGRVPLHWAAHGGDEYVVQLLLRVGADHAAIDNRGRTPICIAARKGKQGAVRVLINNEANIATKDIDGGTPLHHAAQKGHLEVAKLLLDEGGDLTATDRVARTPLHHAVLQQDIEVVRLLLDRGANPTDTDKYHETPLFLTVQYDNIIVAKMLLDKGASPTTLNQRGQTPLFLACQNNSREMVLLLLENIENPSDIVVDGDTPLHLAVKHDCPRLVRFLLEKSPYPSCTGRFSMTPLHWAALWGFNEVAQILLDNGADHSALDEDGATPLHSAVIRSPEISRMLLDNGADSSIADEDGRTPMHEAVSYGRLETARMLRDNGADFSRPDKHGQRPLHLAAKRNSQELVHLILETGVNPSATDDDGETPLYWAVRSGSFEVVRVLLSRGVDFTVSDKRGQTLLHWAAKHGNTELIVFLLDRGAIPSPPNQDGETPLHWAVKRDHQRVVQMLLDKGANPAASDKDGETPLHWAVESEHEGLIQILLEKGADASAPNKDGETPLHTVVSRKYPNLRMAEMLINTGASITASNRYGYTALHRAAKRGHHDVSRMLLAKGAEITARNKDHETPLHLAIHAPDEGEKLVELLLSEGADPLARNKDGQTPLHYAAILSNLYGSTDTRYVIQLLVAGEADLSDTDKSGSTPLHLAARRGSRIAVQTLLGQGANPYAKDHKGMTPLEVAEYHGNNGILSLLHPGTVGSSIAATIIWTDGVTRLQKKTEEPKSLDPTASKALRLAELDEAKGDKYR